MTSAAASLGGVTSIDFYDVTGRGVHQLIVGTDDGFVHLYEVNVDGDHVTHPNLIYTKVIIFHFCHSNVELKIVFIFIFDSSFYFNLI